MELGFLSSALRRYWPVVLIFALLGGVALWLRGGDEELFESRGVVIVRPPDDDAGNFAGDRDRYVIGQISVMESDRMAQRVATAVGDTTPEVVASAASFDHEPETDVIEVVVETANADFSQRIANAYLEGYVATINDLTNSLLGPIEAEIGIVRDELAAIDSQITDAMRPFVEAPAPTDGSAYPPIPTAEQVVPALASQHDLRVSRLTDLEATRTQLLANHSQRATIVQDASLPTAPETESGKLLVAAGIVGGGFIGALAAVLSARLSPRVLDDLQAEEILGQPVVGELPADRIIARDPRAALEEPPPSIIGFVESLCVQVESNAQRAESSLTVVVVGTQRSAGTTTLASALASQFAANGSSVLLVDADLRHPQLTTLFGNPVDDDDETTNGPRRLPNGQFTSTPKLLHRLNTTIVPNLRVASFSGESSRTTMRRQQVATAVDEATAQADVVVFDGGPLMTASVTVQLSRLCDAVIVAMPPRQNVKPLSLVAGTLRGWPFLPVRTPAGRRSLGERFGALPSRPPRSKRFAKGSHEAPMTVEHGKSIALAPPRGFDPPVGPKADVTDSREDDDAELIPDANGAGSAPFDDDLDVERVPQSSDRSS